MGIGPAFAIPQAAQRAGMKVDEFDLVEINEAFAPQVLACVHALHLDVNKLNPNGGAIALGHPLGGSGARIMTTMLYHMRDKGIRYGLQTMCEGGGTANVTIIERL